MTGTPMAVGEFQKTQPAQQIDATPSHWDIGLLDNQEGGNNECNHGISTPRASEK